MGRPLASIVISNFNYERFLMQAIDSALNQTFANTEVLVVDDGSTDRSRDVIASYGPRVTPVFKENGGMMSAYNAGFSVCRGDFLVFLDADDLLLPSALTRVAPHFENTRVAKVHWPLWETDERGQKTGNVIPGQPLLDGDFGASTLLRGPDCYVSPPTSGNAWSRAFLEKVLPASEPEYRQHADTYLATLAPLFGRVACIDEPQALYRIHGSNDYASRSTAEKNHRNLLIYDRRCESLNACLTRQNVDANPGRWKQDNRYYAWMQRLYQTTKELTALIPAGATFLFVDDDQCADRWGGSNLIDGRTALPFLEGDGKYWGPPADDETAVRELERLRHAGAHFIAFAWPSFWWLEHYGAFHQYLCATFDCILRNERLVLFDLRRVA
jgi:glycosyltransferase involved in cell wall biosynthesis